MAFPFLEVQFLLFQNNSAPDVTSYIPTPNSIKVRVFFGKNIEKDKNDKNYYYFYKSNIPVINSIVDSRNMVKVS